jgi:cellulose synthase operon protein C
MKRFLGILSGHTTRHTVVALLLGLGAGRATLAASYYEDALQRFESRDYPGAVIQLKNALKTEPNKLAIQFLLGKALQKNGEVLGAEVAYNEAIKLGISRSEVVIPLAETLMAQGRHRDMLLHPQLQTTSLPVDAQQGLMLLRGAAQSDLGDHKGALETIASARALNDRNAKAWLAEAPIRIRTRQFTEAQQAADRGIALAPNEAEGHYVLGSVWHVQARPDVALASYKKALGFDALHAEALIASAGILLDRGNKAEAQKTLDQLKKAAPNEPRAAYMRSLLAEMNGQPDKVKTALQEVTNLLDPVPVGFVQYRPQLLMLNGLAHYGLGEMSKARQYLEALNKVQPNSPAVRLLARIQLNSGDSVAAIPLLETYLRTAPDDGMALTLLGSAYVAQGKTAKATQILQEALKKQDKAEVRAALGMSLLKGGDTAAAISELETAWRKDPSQVQAGTTLAQLHMDNNRLPMALAIVKDLIKGQPTNPGLHAMLGDVLLRSGQLTSARQAFDKALKLAPKMAHPALQIARMDIATNQLDAADQRLTALMRDHPKNSDVMAERGRISERRGNPDEALRWLIRAREVSNKKDLRWNLALVELYLRQGKVPQASEEIKLALAKQPDNLNTLLMQARVELAASNTTSARNTLNTATRIAQFNAPMLTAIAQLQLAANDVNGAAYTLSKTESESSNYLPAQVLMAKVEQLQGAADKAMARAKQITTRSPRLAVGYSLQGDLANARGATAEAIAFYRQARAIENNSNTTVALMRALMSLDKTAEALDIGRQRLRQASNDVAVQMTVGELLVRAGRHAEAAPVYRQVLKLDPQNVSALNNVANLHIKLKDLSAARQASEQALKLAPNNPLVIDTLGWVMYLQGQFEQALPLLRDARLRAPGNPEIRYHLAKVLMVTQRKPEARNEAREALRISNQFDGAEDARQIANAAP